MHRNYFTLISIYVLFPICFMEIALFHFEMVSENIFFTDFQQILLLSPSKIDCILQCVRTTSCEGIVYDSVSRECILHSFCPSLQCRTGTFYENRKGYCSKKYTDCKSIKHSGETESGVYTIHPYGPCNDTGIQTSCDMTTDGGGWTIFQRRFDNSTNFYNGWHSYKVGFGNVSGEYWLGNDVIHQLTTKPSSLYVMVKDFGDERKYAKYSNFSVSDESDGYRLFLSGYSGTAGDSLNNQRLPTTIANGMRFTTYDRDNDLNHGNCATQQKGGWWYRACHSSNLNGYYCKPYHLGYPFCNIWHTYNNRSEGMEQSVMMFRRN